MTLKQILRDVEIFKKVTGILFHVLILKRLSRKLLIFIKRNVQKYQKHFNKPIPNSIPLLKQTAIKACRNFLAEFSEKKGPNIFCYFAS